MPMCCPIGPFNRVEWSTVSGSVPVGLARAMTRFHKLGCEDGSKGAIERLRSVLYLLAELAHAEPILLRTRAPHRAATMSRTTDKELDYGRHRPQP